jgi:predicted dehydrogenase
VRFVELARTLGAPLVFRMNLNQQSSGLQWEAHKRLLESLSPIVDCGVHYVDVWCQITRAAPTSVHAVGARLADDIAAGMYNYGHLEVTFADGSVGWYEAGWGPMMSETAFFVKDVIGPKGSVSIVMAETDSRARSADINTHTKTNQILIHSAELRADGAPAHPKRARVHCRRTGSRRTLRTRAAISAARDRGGPRSRRSHGRCGEDSANRSCRGRIGAHGPRRQSLV